MSKRKTRKDKIEFSDEQLEMMERLSGLGITVKQICYILGVSHQTLYRRLTEDGGDQISETLHRGRAVALSKVAEKAFEIALEGDTSMIRYILSTKIPEKMDIKAFVTVAPFVIRGKLLKKHKNSSFFEDDGVTPISEVHALWS